MGSESLICLKATVSFPGESPLPIQVRGSNKSAQAVILDGSCSSQKHTSVHSCNEGAGASIFQVNNVNISQVTRTPHRPPNGHRHQQAHGDPPQHLQLGSPRLPRQHFTPQFASRVAASFAFEVESKSKVYSESELK